MSVINILKISHADSLLNKVLGEGAILSNLFSDTTTHEIVKNNHAILSETLNLLIILSTVFLYCYTLYRGKEIVSTILSYPFSEFKEQKIRESTDNNTPYTINILFVMFVFSVIIGASKLVTITNVSNKILTYEIAIISICFLIYFTYSLIIKKIICWYGKNSDFFDELCFEQKLACSVFGIIGVPITILTILMPFDVVIYIKYLIYLLFATSAIYILLKEFIYFKERKVSFLQYILYLCTIDFVPISFIYVIIRRYL